jgi:hypothetical protein
MPETLKINGKINSLKNERLKPFSNINTDSVKTNTIGKIEAVSYT